MRLDKHREAGSTRRFDLEAVPADYSSTYSLEHLGRFRWGEPIKIGFQSLNREFVAQELFCNRR